MSLSGMRRTAVAGLACAAVLTGCANGDTTRKALPAQTTASLASASLASVSSRGFIDCGTFVYAQGEHRSPTSASCMVDAAHSGQVARLIETRSTTEGDPIITKYATNERGRMVLVTDSRHDEFGSPTLVLRTYRTSEQDGPAIIVKNLISHAQLWPLRPEPSLSREFGILRPLEVERDCGFRSPLADRPELSGLPLATVQKMEREAGRSVRVLGQDGVCNSGTLDMIESRTNVYLHNGRVVWAQMA